MRGHKNTLRIIYLKKKKSFKQNSEYPPSSGFFKYLHCSSLFWINGCFDFLWLLWHQKLGVQGQNKFTVFSKFWKQDVQTQDVGSKNTLSESSLDRSLLASSSFWFLGLWQHHYHLWLRLCMAIFPACLHFIHPLCISVSVPLHLLYWGPCNDVNYIRTAKTLVIVWLSSCSKTS